MNPVDLTLIVPYREREDHLAVLSVYGTLSERDLNVSIVVIEQAGVGLFNKGALMNAGFLLAERQTRWLCFHDVDMLPQNGDCDYSCPSGIRHLAGRVQQFGYAMPYSDYLGGVITASVEAFRETNGFSNQYLGWGAEDEDFRLRIRLAQVTFDRKPGRYDSLTHAPRTARAENYKYYNTFRAQARWLLKCAGFVKWVSARAGHRGEGTFATMNRLIQRRMRILPPWRDGIMTTKFSVVSRHSLASRISFDRPVSNIHEIVTVRI